MLVKLWNTFMFILFQEDLETFNEMMIFTKRLLNVHFDVTLLSVALQLQHHDKEGESAGEQKFRSLKEMEDEAKLLASHFQ